MAAGISISVASDTRAFSQGVKSGVVTPLENVEDALKDISRGGDRAGDDLAKAFTGAQRDTREMSKEYERLADTIKTESRGAGRSIGDDIKKGSHEASEGLDEIKESGRSNAIEVAASFDGSATSIADGFQGLAAEVFAGFGPAGVVAGVAVAAGIGLISTAFGQAGEDADALAERTQAAYDDMKESGLNYLSETRIGEGIDEITQNADKLNQAYKDAAESGAVISTVLRAQAGDYDAISLVQSLASAKQTELTKKQEDYIKVNGDSSAGIDAQVGALDDLKGRFQGVAGTTDTAVGRINLFRDAMSQSGPVTDAAASKVDNLNGKLKGLQSPRISVNLDTGDAERAIARIANTTVRVQAELELRSGNLVH